MEGHRDQALKLIMTARSADAVDAAVALLSESDPELRRALLERYAYLAVAPRRRDPGTYVRSALLRALGPVATVEDLFLLEEAAATYEYGSYEVANLLRAAAVVTMAQVDPARAAFHAARLLGDQSAGSAQPALTALSVLAAQGETVAVYAYLATNQEARADVLAEALRSMVEAPASAVSDLVRRYGDERYIEQLLDVRGANHVEVLLLGLFDLVLGRPDAGLYAAFLLGFLRSSQLSDLCRYVAAAIVAGRDESLIDGMRRLRADVDAERAAVLEDALALLRG